MIKVEQYPIVVPEVYTEKIWANVRTDASGDRNAQVYSYFADNEYSVNIPWIPVAAEWVEVYVNGSRLVNSRVHTADGRVYGQMAGTIYENFNVVGNVIEFSDRITGNLEIVCDTKASHWWGGQVIDCDNIQSITDDVFLSNINLPIDEWPISTASQEGFVTTIKYKPGPIFNIVNNPIFIKNAQPESFNTVLVGDQSVATNSSVVFSSAITDDFIADGFEKTFNLTDYPSGDNLVVRINDEFVYKTEYTYGNISIEDGNVTTIVTQVEFNDIVPEANANVSIFYIPFNASYKFESMTKPGGLTGVATDFLSRRINRSLYSEPIILNQPVHGYARLTTDRKNIVYVPDIGFQGTDFFKWALITQHGQIGIPMCTEVNVISPG